MMAHSPSQQQNRAGSESPCLGMDGCMEDEVGAAVRLCEEEIQQARWFGWSSGSWSLVQGTLSALMNNGEKARRRGKKRQWRQEEEGKEEEGVRQRCSSDWRGGSSTGFVLLRCSHCCSARSPSLPCFFFSLCPCFSLFVSSLSPSFVSFSPAVVCQPQQHVLFRTHDLTESGEKGGALITAWRWCMCEVQKGCISD